MPRVLHIVPAMFGSDGVVGGAERYALELARHMAAIVPTRLVAFGDEDRDERIGDLRVRVMGHPWYVRGQRTNPFKPRLLNEIMRTDVIHCHQQHVVASSVAAMVGRLAGRKVFVSDLGGGGWDISGYINTDRWYSGHLHISQYSRSVMGHESKPWAHVILGGVDTEKFSPVPSKDDAWGEREAVYVGRILPHKGVDDLVEAATANAGVTVIGRPYNAQFMEDLKRLANGKRVTFVHDADDSAIVDAYRRALCVVLPSVYRTRYGDDSRVPELLGQTLLEGMACGVPAICTRVASMPEIVEDGVSGFIVPPNSPAALREKLTWLRNHPKERAEMGHAARRRILEHFTWSSVVDRCLAIYRGQAKTIAVAPALAG
jgi:glycosyltransferase involved in cell wall biosynthesis